LGGAADDVERGGGVEFRAWSDSSAASAKFMQSDAFRSEWNVATPRTERCAQRRGASTYVSHRVSGHAPNVLLGGKV
jgi:hypothetical protein